MKRFQRNIDTKGRVARALGGLAFAIAACFLWRHSQLGAGLCLALAAFMLFEAGRGWCAARACGIRTPL